MPAATSKPELLTALEKNYAALSKVIVSIEADDALAQGEDDTSIKDIIAHRAHWIDLFFTWYQNGIEGIDDPLPAPGYKWSDLKAYNAQLRARQTDLSWEGACSALEAAHSRLCTFVGELSEAALYGAPMKGGNGKWTTGRWAEAAGPSHYRSAAKEIRKRMKAL